jgi:hypothetical protein
MRLGRGPLLALRLQLNVGHAAERQVSVANHGADVGDGPDLARRPSARGGGVGVSRVALPPHPCCASTGRPHASTVGLPLRANLGHRGVDNHPTEQPPSSKRYSLPVGTRRSTAPASSPPPCCSAGTAIATARTACWLGDRKLTERVSWPLVLQTIGRCRKGRAAAVCWLLPLAAAPSQERPRARPPPHSCSWCKAATMSAPARLPRTAAPGQKQRRSPCVPGPGRATSAIC